MVERVKYCNEYKISEGDRVKYTLTRGSSSPQNSTLIYSVHDYVLCEPSSVACMQLLLCNSVQELDLTNPATFRDFSLPMGAQTEERLKRFIERYNLTKEDPTGQG